ncbi:GNAT family N-acetyltransferase [Bordetella sp. N]|uniref:GNAT family N-acetyltransferase n=1 Tax=Bordetella sp. N TaxID=1746199 RepID=UPI000710EF01|nr:GNAT family N-acetyltransferase [Bordetella sp. N]ALM82587.1 acetyltransferase [Bordetella sp. N]
MRIRRFRLGDEPALFQIFHSAIHLIAARDYTPEQIAAWAPADLDQELWRERMRGIRPFIAEIDGSPSAGGLLEQLLAGGQADHDGQAGLTHAPTSASTSASVREPIIVGYADVQESGYIDHFFVSGHHPRQGIGNALMARLHEEAARLELPELSSDVSRSAQPFFAHHGFDIIEQRHPVRRGIVIPNALMRKRLLC